LHYSEEDLEQGGEKALEIMQACKEALGGDYFGILAREYGEKDVGYTLLQTLILQIPFASFMTTNIDPCLEVASEHLCNHGRKLNIQIWPEIAGSDVSSGDVYYLHGKIPRTHQNLNLNRLRMTTVDYEEAYAGTDYIAGLLKQAILKSYILLFIGYGLR